MKFSPFASHFKAMLLLGLTVMVTVFNAPPKANAFEPNVYGGFGGYGSYFGPTFQFRNRLPTPPYFSIYSPVYYGQRFERPYGISPFAALPMVQPSAAYQAHPKATATTVANPHCVNCGDFLSNEALPSQSEISQAAKGESHWVENPYVTSDSAIATK